jgi:hypothetical protein
MLQQTETEREFTCGSEKDILRLEDLTANR